MSKFLLLLGPSGVGKSTIINELLKLDNKFVYISPYMTRQLREGEKNKIAVNDKQMDEMWRRGELLIVNKLYGNIRYGTPRLPIAEALSMGKFPVLDWPIDKLKVITDIFLSQLFVVYVSPPSIDVLRERLIKDGRDVDGTRLASAMEELQKFWTLQYTGAYHYEIVSEDEKATEIAKAIYINYLKSF